MWSRSDIKARGKASFKANYFNCVVVSLLLTMIIGSGYTVVNNSALTNMEEQLNSMNMDQTQAMILLMGALSAVGTVAAIFKIIDILILNPLEVGCQYFFLQNTREPVSIGAIGRAFSPGWINNVVALLLRDIFLAFWFFLFIIPGFVKRYSYRMVPFIIAEYPQMSATEAITRSRQLMDGHKWNTFVMDLSFLGWDFLTAITFGIAGIFWTQPYKFNAYAQLYLELKELSNIPNGTRI